MQIIKLNNGIDCPVIGLGTFMLSPKDAQNSTREALKMGYRLIDTANAYVNERAVGRGIRESFVARMHSVGVTSTVNKSSMSSALS